MPYSFWYCDVTSCQECDAEMTLVITKEQVSVALLPYYFQV